MPDILVSPATAITIAIGVAISLVYLRAMGLALRRAAVERDVPDDGPNDAYVHNFAGAVIAVANTRYLPWSPYHGKAGVPHWVLLRENRNGRWHLADDFTALLPAVYM